MSDFSIYAGEARSIAFTLKTAAGAAYDLTGHTVYFSLGTGQTRKVLKSSPASGVVLDAPNTLGTGTVTLSSTDTAQPVGDMDYALWVDNTVFKTGKVSIVAVVPNT